MFADFFNLARTRLLLYFKGKNLSYINRDCLEEAAKCWNQSQALEAGRIIFENIPNDIRPLWASRILKLVLKKSRISSPLLKEALKTAEKKSLWKNGHRIFDKIRKSVLEFENIENKSGLNNEQRLLRDTLLLAELVAKVTYNATNPPDEFDEDSGWWIAELLKDFVKDTGNDTEFSKAVWAALCFET